MRDAVVARPGDWGRISAPIMHSVKATKKPNQHQNWNWHSKQPQKQIASHRRFSFLIGELDGLGQVPDTLPQCKSWNECTSRGLTPAMENERSKWRTNIGEERTMNQNPNQKPGQQQQGGQQQGGQEKPGQQQQGGQKPGQQQQGGQQNQQNR
jgi:hypothetical protein